MDQFSPDSCLTNSDDAKLVSLIDAAQDRVILLSPGVSQPVATALSSAWERLGRHSVTVIIDADAEVCRLGYGTFEGLRELMNGADKAGGFLGRQSGVRIGLLISDHRTLIFTPTPRLIEADPDHPLKPNAVLLSTSPAEITRDLGAGDNPFTERTLGMEPATRQDVEKIEADLKHNPPVKFDLARRVRVFNSKFQFAELEMTGCYISRRKVQIPNRLLGLTKDRKLQSQFQAHFNLADEKLEVKIPDHNDSTKEIRISEETLKERRAEICRRFLISLKDYGSVVLRENKQALEDAVAELKTEIEQFQKGIVDALQAQIENNVASLVEALLPAVRQSPPDHYVKFHGSGITDDQLKTLLCEELRKAFGDAARLTQEMRVSLIFKDVAYESLRDERFLKVAQQAMPHIRELHEEYDAARAYQP